MALYGYDINNIIIPPDDKLFRRIPKTTFWNLIRKLGMTKDYIPPKIFKPVNGGLSVDWERFSTPQWTQARKGNGENYGVLSMVTLLVREIPLDVEYTPTVDNSAHTDIKMPLAGEELTWTRMALHEISEIVIPVPSL